MVARGLGRGFESLIPTELVDDEFDPTSDQDLATSRMTEIKVSEIVRDEEQPRQKFNQEELEALAASIKEHGILQPLVVTREDGKYKIVAGERRWRAAKLAGLETVPTIVRTLDAQNRLELSIIENAQREDLNAIELATAYAKLKTQFNLNDKEIAKRVGRSETGVKNTMRLLALPDSAKKAMMENNLSEGVMRPLVTVDKDTVEKVVPLIVSEGWTVRKVEQFVAGNKKKSSARAVKTGDFKKEEAKLSEKWATKVRVSSRSVTFSCKNEKELKELLRKLG